MELLLNAASPWQLCNLLASEQQRPRVSQCATRLAGESFRNHASQQDGVCCVCVYAANAGEFSQCLSANTGGAKTTSGHVILEKKKKILGNHQEKSKHFRVDLQFRIHQEDERVHACVLHVRHKFTQSLKYILTPPPSVLQVQNYFQHHFNVPLAVSFIKKKIIIILRRGKMNHSFALFVFKNHRRQHKLFPFII